MALLYGDLMLSRRQKQWQGASGTCKNGMEDAASPICATSSQETACGVPVHACDGTAMLPNDSCRPPILRAI